jgi:hypothetical protein
MRSQLLALVLILPMVSTAQGVWRCGPEGRSFSDTPCADGRALDVKTADRPAADVRAAQAQAERDIHLAEMMRRERHAQEVLQRGNGIAALGPEVARLRSVKPARPSSIRPEAKLRRQLHPEAHGTWQAVAPASRRTKD